MIELGKSLRAAREAKGYTVKQLADMTRMSPSKIEDLENEDFSHIAAPIYGRGFVRLYCDAVGLDPKPYIAEFMDIMNGNREPEIKAREVSAPVPPPAPPAFIRPSEPVEPEAEEPPPAREPFRLEQEVQPPPAQSDLFSQDVCDDQPVEKPSEQQKSLLSRYAAPARTATAVLTGSYMRIGLLAAGAALLAVLLFCGIRMLYRATAAKPAAPVAEQAPTPAPKPAPAAPAKVAVPAKPSAPAKAPAPAKTAVPAKRTPQKIPSLYID